MKTIGIFFSRSHPTKTPPLSCTHTFMFVCKYETMHVKLKSHFWTLDTIWERVRVRKRKRLSCRRNVVRVKVKRKKSHSVNCWRSGQRESGKKNICKRIVSQSHIPFISNSFISLFIKGYDVEDDGAKAIAQILKTNTTLAEIRMYNKFITDDGAKALAEALKTNKTLRSLSLSGKSVPPLLFFFNVYFIHFSIHSFTCFLMLYFFKQRTRSEMTEPRRLRRLSKRTRVWVTYRWVVSQSHLCCFSSMCILYTFQFIHSLAFCCCIFSNR